MIALVSMVRRVVRAGSRLCPGARGVAGTAVAAALAVGQPALAQNAENLANLKGYGLQQYLAGKGGAAPARPSAPHTYAAPQRSVLQVYTLPYQHAYPATVALPPAGQPNYIIGPAPALLPADVVVQRPVVAAPAPAVEPQPVAFIVAHLPPGADIWIDEKPMFADVKAGEVTMVTPPLEKGKWFTYTARVRWVEDGKWVGQMHTFEIRAGDIHHMDVTPSTAPSVEREIAANLEKLAPADRKAAAEQKVCAVQDTIRLGSMGAPVKVTLDGKDVYLCCKGCEAAAKKDPAKALAAAEKAKEKK